MNTQQLGKIYEDVVGYNISEDDETLSSEDIIRIMKEYDQEDSEQPFKQKGVYE